MFVDLSRLIAHNSPARHGGVAAADVDGDGRLEFVVAGEGGPNRVLRWSNGLLRDIAGPEVADANSATIGIVAGDIDGDGREELYILNARAERAVRRNSDRLLDFQPDGHWRDLFSLSGNGHHHEDASQSVAVIDRRGVGRYGFFVANDGRPMRLYELGPGGVLADLAPPLGLNRIAAGRGMLTLPVFGDHPDILCLNARGQNLAFRNCGDGTFAECAAEQRLDDGGEQGRSIAAFDAGGGAIGLSWGNWAGPHRLMIRREDCAWKDRATAGLAFPSAVGNAIAADFDNDGHDEVFFNNAGEANRLFGIQAGADGAMPGPAVTMLDPGEALDPDGFGAGAAVCDIDGDGVLELLLARGGGGKPQPLGLYKSRLAGGNNWLRVRPLTRFGAPARGAVVRAEAEGRVRVKGICGGSGYRCQMEPVAHFGLGPHGHADRVQVTWPDGAAVILLNPRTNSTMTVPYPRG